MKLIRVSSAIASFSCLIFTQFSYAGAFQLYELGTPIVATAGVGQAAVANDASTAYFNPAGMALLPSSEILIGTQMILPYINFSPNSTNTISGNNGGTASLLTPGIGSYFVYDVLPPVKLGLSLTSPYGGALNYNNHWVGRYNVQQMLFYTINLNPAISYAVNDWLALGAGVAIEYANLNQTVALRLTSFLDGQANSKLDNTAWGFNLGMMITPCAGQRFGIAYRSQIVHHLGGKTNFLNISATPDTTSKMVMPANVIASFASDFTDQFTLLGELGWSNWSSMVNTLVRIENFTAVTPLNWRNTYRLGLGAQYRPGADYLFQTGIAYDSSPTSTNQRLPVLPMDRQVRVGAGMAYAFNRTVSMAFSYEYINFGKANIYNSSADGVLAGSYSRNFANVFQASLNVNC